MTLEEQIQEKEEQRDRYKTRINILRRWGTMYGICTIVTAGAAVYYFISPIINDVYAAGMGLLAFANGYYCTTHIRDIIRNSRDMGNLEKEIEGLETKPEYQAIAPSK